MRPLDSVVKAVLSLIPDGYPDKNYLKDELDAYVEIYYKVKGDEKKEKALWEHSYLLLLRYLTPLEQGSDWKNELFKVWDNTCDYMDYLANAQ